MMNDIVPFLLEDIEKDFNKSIKESKKITALKELLETNQATYEDANEYAIEIGETLAKVFKKHISSETLPNGKMYFNIGERILTPTLNNNYNLVAEYTRIVQDELNKQIGLGLKTSIPKLNKDKIKGFIDRLDYEENFDDVSWILDEPVINFTQQGVNDVLELNASFQSLVGLTPKIKRTLVGGACKWCVSLAGTYEYPDVPEDVYKRHDRCRCTVEYIPNRGIRKQNIWNKKWG